MSSVTKEEIEKIIELPDAVETEELKHELWRQDLHWYFIRFKMVNNREEEEEELEKEIKSRFETLQKEVNLYRTILTDKLVKCTTEMEKLLGINPYRLRKRRTPPPEEEPPVADVDEPSVKRERSTRQDV